MFCFGQDLGQDHILPAAEEDQGLVQGLEREEDQGQGLLKEEGMIDFDDIHCFI